jgi:hypothetical protein
MLKRVLLSLCLLLLVGVGSAWAQESIPREAAIAAARPYTNARPSSWLFEILAPTNQSSLGCPIATTNVDLGRQVIPYRYVLTYPSGDYVVYASSDGTVVQLCDTKFGDASGSIIVPPTPTPMPTATPDPASTPIATPTSAFGTTVDCKLSPSGSLANVRRTPSTGGETVGQIFAGQTYNVTARSSNPADQWYYIGAGWVFGNIVTLKGECNALGINDGLIGTGVGLVAPATDALQAMRTYPCPSDYLGYMTPRLKTGTATARVASGGVPNTLRSQPIANDSIGQRLGTIQPGRTLDLVLQGPACSNGVVWWFVEVDGRQGWTAESNLAQNDYYLEPTPGNEATSLPNASAGTPSEGLLINQREDATYPIAMLFSGDGNLLVADDIKLSDESERHVLIEYNGTTGEATDNGIATPARIIGLQPFQNGVFAVYTADGKATFYDNLASPTVSAEGIAVTQEISALLATTSSDRRVIAYVSCAGSSPCSVFNVNLRTFSGTSPLWTVTLPMNEAPFRIAFSPDDSLVGVLTFNALYVYDRVTGIQQARLSNSSDTFGLLSFAFKDSGQVFTTICKQAGIQSGCIKGELTLWSVASGTILGVVESSDGNPTHLLYDSFQDVVFVGDAEGVVTLRNASTGELIETITLPLTDEGFASSVELMSYDARTGRLAVADFSGRIFIFNVLQG